MKLYVEVENDQTKNHPAFEDNLLNAFGNIPLQWEPFERIERPAVSVYEILESQEPTYQKVDGVWKDVWALRPLTTEESAAKQQTTKDEWASNGFASWIFDDITCKFEAPAPYPQDDKNYYWDEPTTSWVELLTSG